MGEFNCLVLSHNFVKYFRVQSSPHSLLNIFPFYCENKAITAENQMYHKREKERKKYLIGQSDCSETEYSLSCGKDSVIHNL